MTTRKRKERVSMSAEAVGRFVDKVKKKVREDGDLNRDKFLEDQSIFDKNGEAKVGKIFGLLISRYLIGGFAVIWSLNTLFILGIGHGPFTYLAVFMLTSRFGKMGPPWEAEIGLWRDQLREEEEDE